ncbi:mRNA interferase HigB [Burkholderia sp. D7]|nr:mRNA interferase HigB [Burkholderia sp. D7]
MRVISNKPLVAFAATYPDAATPLQIWRRTIEGSSFGSYADLKLAFNATDKVGDFYVFDIGGNKYRLIAAVHFNVQKLYVRHVLTHKEYDKWTP